MRQMFFIQYEVRPLLQNDCYAEVGGAFANCFVMAESACQAEKLALQNFAANHWEVVRVEENASITSRGEYEDEWLEWYDEAIREGECYVYHQWPNEPQEGDDVH